MSLIDNIISPASLEVVHADHSQISLFLTQLKEAITRRRYVVNQRARNNEFLSRHNMTPREREYVLRSLQIEDYVTGPGMNGDTGVWEFTKKYRGAHIRIKIKLLPFDGVFARDGDYAKDGHYAKCSAFHD